MSETPPKNDSASPPSEEEAAAYKQLRQFYSEKLGWCGCATPVEVMVFLRDVLSAIDDRFDSNATRQQQDEAITKLDALLPGALGMSYRYMLDALGLTEHGGNVVGAWLTPAGREALALLDTDIEKAFALAGTAITPKN